MRNLIYRAGILVLGVCSSFVFAETKLLTELEFPRDQTLPGWSWNPRMMKVEATVFQIRSLAGPGNEWHHEWIQYDHGFSLKGSTVQVEIDLVSQNAWREFYVALMPLKKDQAKDGQVILSFPHGKGSSIVEVRRGADGFSGKPVKSLKLPFTVDRNIRIYLTLTDGVGELKVGKSKQENSFRLGRLLPKEGLDYPYTLALGTRQRGNSNEPALAEILRVRILTNKMDELAVLELSGNTEGKDETVTCIDLHPYANRCFEDETPDDNVGGWTDQGANDFRFFPKGYQYFRNIPFYIADHLAVVGNSPEPGCLVLKSKNAPDLPIRSKSIAVNVTAEYLYFLHACAYGNSLSHSADYQIVYDDGSSIAVPLIAGRDIGDWWEPKELVHAAVAWRGRNPMKDNIGCYVFEWKNPTPNKKIISVVFESKNTETIPILLGLTASPRRLTVGDYPRVYRESKINLCEYRQRIKTAPVFENRPGDVTLMRSIPISETSKVESARIDVIRYRAKVAARVQCRIGSVTQSVTLKPDELRAQFSFNQPEVLAYLTENKSQFPIHVTIDDPEGLGAYRYEMNPNHDFVPDGEDFEHGMVAVTGVFMVTPFLSEHRLSGYVENRPKPMSARPVDVEKATLALGETTTNWLGAEICLSSRWQWQAGGGKDYAGTAENIPTSGWENKYIPCNVGEEVFKQNPQWISAWFKKEIVIPAQWKDRRVVVRFEGVADFATVFCNGKKLSGHEGLNAFEVDLTSVVRPGQNNTLVVFAEDACKGLLLIEKKEKVSDLSKQITPYKGHAYRVQLIRGAWDQNPDEVKLLLDGKDVGRKAASIDEVVQQGEGRYYREQDWNKSILYFSLPENGNPDSLKDRLEIAYYWPGLFNHLSRYEPPHHWREPRARALGLYRDVYLKVTGKSSIEDVFVKPSVRNMELTVDVETKNLPAGAKLVGCVRDGAKTVLDLGTLPLKDDTAVYTLKKEWRNPTFWEPSNPYLYYLQLELKDKAGNVLDRRFVRFGFREFWIDGVHFKLNGKTIYLNNASMIANNLPMHRQQMRWHYLDLNQQGNINLVRWHIGGTLYPETVEVSDEMGMLQQPENMIDSFPPFVYEKDELQLDRLEPFFKWHTDAIKRMRNSPSVISWSSENEHMTQKDPEEVKKAATMIEAMLRLSAAIKKVDPTRPIVNNGGHALGVRENWKDPRVEMVDGHYVSPTFFADWQRRIGKPCTVGEESLGGPFAWTYQNEIRGRRSTGKDYSTFFYDSVNAAGLFIGERIKIWKKMEIGLICPFAFQQDYNPFMLSWENVHFGDQTPDVPWPAQSGEHVKPACYRYGSPSYGSINFFDPAAPRVYVRTWNAVRDNFDEVPKLEPRWSPEVVVVLTDGKGKPLVDQLVWLIPTNQPGTPIGLHTDENGRAWFWCKSGPGQYIACVSLNDRTFMAEVSPAVVGEWMQVKQVHLRVKN